MTLEELKKFVAEKREFYAKMPGFAPGVTLVVNRRCRGSRCRIFPGVYGEIVYDNGNSVVAMVSLDDLENYIAKAEASDEM